jgi:GntR family transcriptional regulator, rspAB operon transcriptional repressor
LTRGSRQHRVYDVPDALLDISYVEESSDGLAPLDTRRQSLTDMVYDSIRGSIVEKRLSPGTVVPEASLAARLQVSKTPVREALLRLQSIGLVESDGGRGLRVVSPSEAAIQEAYEVRVVLEQGLCRRAAERAGRTECEEILGAAKRSLECAKAGDVREGFRSWDKVFHRAVAVAAGNPRLAKLSEDAAALASVLRERDVPDVQDAIRCGRQHIDIAKAIAAGDPNGAAAASDVHVNDVKNMVLKAFRERYG